MLLPVPKIDPILGRLHKTFPISITLTNIETLPTALTTDTKEYEYSSDNIIDAPKSSQISD